MSKMDDLRAMREARYAQQQARAKGAAAPAKRAAPVKAAAKPAKAATKPAATKKAPAPAPAEGAAEQLCGHRNMSGRTCTREHGHSAKSHRYS